MYIYICIYTCVPGIFILYTVYVSLIASYPSIKWYLYIWSDWKSEMTREGEKRSSGVGWGVRGESGGGCLVFFANTPRAAAGKHGKKGCRGKRSPGRTAWGKCSVVGGIRANNTAALLGNIVLAWMRYVCVGNMILAKVRCVGFGNELYLL